MFQMVERLYYQRGKNVTAIHPIAFVNYISAYLQICLKGIPDSSVFNTCFGPGVKVSSSKALPIPLDHPHVNNSFIRYLIPKSLEKGLFL